MSCFVMQKLSLPQVFQEIFGGAYLDQKICRDCEHTYDREESFLSVSLPVKSRSLQESLKEHVKGEMLEGENAYLCEKCQEKVMSPLCGDFQLLVVNTITKSPRPGECIQLYMLSVCIQLYVVAKTFFKKWYCVWYIPVAECYPQCVYGMG